MKIKNTYIPSYEEALEICSSNETFYENKHIVDGYKVSTFNYRLSLYDDFINPIKEKPEINAKELRGLTYVFNKDGSLFKRYLHLQKFWNLNQVVETEYKKLKDLKIVEVFDKVDGSLCSFIKLPNGKVVSKTQNCFDNEQTSVINELYKKNENLQKFCEFCFDRGYSVLFEYVSFYNRIVLEYDESKLILLRVRDENGNYLDLNKIETYDLEIAESEKIKSLEEFIEISETLKNKEGWVLTLKDGDEYIFVKIKTKWYCERHRLMENIERENDIISLILSRQIDDVLGQLNPDEDKKRIEFINDIMKKVNKFIFSKTKEVNELASKYNGSLKDFAISYSKDKNFHLAIKVVKGESALETVKEYVIRKNKKLEEARKFLRTL
ncbi:MAG: RNA ligase [archaeon]